MTETDAPNIVILYAHPAPDRSRVNRRMAEAAASLPNVNLHDLYEIYPDFDIDVQKEQAILAKSDLIVFQHPIQWYGMPALLKEWVDVVLESGWAYGPGGDALRGKNFWLAATTGGMPESNSGSDHHQLPFEAFMPPFRQTAALCGLHWLPPYILHGATAIDEAGVEAWAQQYRERLVSYPRWHDFDGTNPQTSLRHPHGK